jgi:hypothetical protein
VGVQLAEIGLSAHASPHALQTAFWGPPDLMETLPGLLAARALKHLDQVDYAVLKLAFRDEEKPVRVTIRERNFRASAHREEVRQFLKLRGFVVRGRPQVSKAA